MDKETMVKEKQILSKQAYDFIKEKIVRGVFLGGQPILESQLCGHLGFSRTPVREALKLLEKENLVTLHPRRGAFITTVPLKRIREIFQVREIIEGEIGRRVASVISERDLTDIEGRLLSIKERLDRPKPTDAQEAVKTGRQLHDLIFRTFGNETLIDFMEMLRLDVERGCDFASKETENMVLFLHHHLEIIDALKHRDGERVKRLLTDHISKARDAVLY